MCPIYEDENTTIADLNKLRKRSKCKVCGGWLNTFLDAESGKVFVACHEWTRSHHEGIEKEASRYQKEGLASLNINTRREIMTQDYGKETTKALDKYIGAVAITRSMATEIVETLWGNAPTIEKTKCILLCQTYQLNPLMRHIYLIGYKRYKDNKLVVDDKGKPVIDWSIQQGIGATRLLAQRKHNYSYLDMTPRKATKAEIEKILGDTADPNCIYGFVHIKDVDTGAEAFGLRGIGKNESIKGTEKGNTHLNMACVRAERLALDRQYPGEMPQDIEVVDERFVPEVGKVNKETGEIVEGEFKEVEATPKEHWCEEHNCPFVLKTGKFGEFYAHKKTEGGWCNEKKKKEKAPKSKTGFELDDNELPEPAPGAIEKIMEAVGVEPEPEPDYPPELDYPPDGSGKELETKPQQSKREPEELRLALYDWIATNMGWSNTKSVTSWLVNACKISEDKIKQDPTWVKQEVAQLQGWTI